MRPNTDSRKIGRSPLLCVIWPAINQRGPERHSTSPRRRTPARESCAKRVKAVPFARIHIRAPTHTQSRLTDPLRLLLASAKPQIFSCRSINHLYLCVLTSFIRGPFAPSLHSLDLILLIAIFVFLAASPPSHDTVDTRLTKPPRYVRAPSASSPQNSHQIRR